MRKISLLLFAAAIALAAVPARAQTEWQVVTRGSTFLPGDDEITIAGYTVPLPNTLHVRAGDRLMYTNLDTPAGHSVTSVGTVPGSDPPRRLFESATLSFNRSGPVIGVENLAPGSYDFICIVHPNMEGTLVVLGS